MSNNPVVTVGVDGSSSAFEALEWAAEYARARAYSLDVVVGVDWPTRTHPYTPFPIAGRSEQAEAEAQQIADRAVARARTAIPSLDVSGRVVTEPPIPALLRASRSGRLVVVGCRGLNAVAETMLGSVSAAVSAHADCPVVVVRTGRQAGADAPVVAGIDGSVRDDDTLAAAFDEASHRGARLIVAHAWSDVPLLAFPGVYLDPWPDLQADAEKLVAGVLSGWADKYPQVQVETRIVRDRPAHALLDLAGTAGLVVVGSHGRGGFTGMLLGSVARRLAHHAGCPVMVVRHPAHDAQHDAHHDATEA